MILGQAQNYQGADFGGDNSFGSLSQTVNNNANQPTNSLERGSAGYTMPFDNGSVGFGAGAMRQSDGSQGSVYNSVSPNVSAQYGPIGANASMNRSNFSMPGYSQWDTTPNVGLTANIPAGDGMLNMGVNATPHQGKSFTGSYNTPLMGGDFGASLNVDPRAKLVEALLGYNRKF